MATTPPSASALFAQLRRLGLNATPELLWVSVPDQRMALLRDGRLVESFAVSTSAKGIGQREGTQQTPLGLHRVAKKIGHGAEPRTVFKSREDTGQRWRPEDGPGENDLILTRILWLEGLEEGLNKGRAADGALVDSFERYIYIHGTNHERALGRPASHGCVRMGNADVERLFERVPEGTLVFISDQAMPGEFA
ncbi:MAG: L,D-transpeptidase [Verrucomicrobiae bacterium]|nr:L,D-transpeptidase [Verrucomicrobiae bacterium]